MGVGAVRTAILLSVLDLWILRRGSRQPTTAATLTSRDRFLLFPGAPLPTPT
jgi:hypothetical protein